MRGHMSNAFKQCTAALNKVGWWRGIEPTPNGERNGEVVNNWRTAKQRGTLQSNVDATAQRVVDMLTFLHLHLRAQLACKQQHVTLVGALVS